MEFVKIRLIIPDIMFQNVRMEFLDEKTADSSLIALKRKRMEFLGILNNKKKNT